MNPRKLALQDLFIGAWVQEFLKVPARLGTPMYVESIFEDGDVYLTFKGNSTDPFEANIMDIQGIPLKSDTMHHFGFSETEHNVFELKCDTFKVVVIINEHQGYRLVRAKIQHEDGGFQLDDNLIYVHQLQEFVFKKCGRLLILDWN